jgi:hypothetical protein
LKNIGDRFDKMGKDIAREINPLTDSELDAKLDVLIREKTERTLRQSIPQANTVNSPVPSVPVNPSNYNANGDGNGNGKSFFTGENKKQLLVHVMQDNIEVDRPIKTNIWTQQVEWKRRIFPISHEDFLIDSKGIHHVYVDCNKMTTKRFKKSVDKCVKCGGKVEQNIDARNARDLLKRKTIEAIWGIDSTHIILLMIMGIALLAIVGFAFYEYTEQQKLQTKINGAIASGDLGVLVDKKPTPPTTTTTTTTTPKGTTK